MLCPALMLRYIVDEEVPQLGKPVIHDFLLGAEPICFDTSIFTAYYVALKGNCVDAHVERWAVSQSSKPCLQFIMSSAASIYPSYTCILVRRYSRDTCAFV